MNSTNCNRWSVFFALLCCACLAASCTDKRRHSAAEGVNVAPTTRSVPADAPPENVALALVQALGDAQTARANGMGRPEARAAYDEALSRVWSLVDSPTIHQYVSQSGSSSLPKNVSEQAAVTAVVESWMSILAHYAQGVIAGSLTKRFVDPKGAAIIYLEAANPADAKVLDEIAAARTPGPSTQAVANLAPRPNVGITVTLKQTDGRWLATRIAIGPAQSGLVSGARQQVLHPPAQTQTSSH